LNRSPMICRKDLEASGDGPVVRRQPAKLFLFESEGSNPSPRVNIKVRDGSLTK